jgi:hypothetical protein
VGLSLVGAKGAPLQAMRLSNFEVGKAKTPMRIRNAAGLAFDNVRINGIAMQPVAETGPETFVDKLKS